MTLNDEKGHVVCRSRKGLSRYREELGQRSQNRRTYWIGGRVQVMNVSGEPRCRRVWVFPKCAEKPPKGFNKDRNMILLAFKGSLCGDLDSGEASWVGNRPQGARWKKVVRKEVI